MIGFGAPFKFVKTGAGKNMTVWILLCRGYVLIDVIEIFEKRLPSMNPSTLPKPALAPGASVGQSGQVLHEYTKVED
jgi:hypothetical protein